PQRNRTVSTPSRNTATNAIVASPRSRPVASAASAFRRSSPPRSPARRCIQTTIHVSTPTARKRTPAWRSSCVSGSSRDAAPFEAKPHASAASTAAPVPSQTYTIPARCPVRDRYVSRMPTISAASSDSRQAMSRVSTIGSLDDEHAAPLLVEVVEELVPTGVEPGQVDVHRLARLDDALPVELEALELDRDRRRVRHL